MTSRPPPVDATGSPGRAPPATPHLYPLFLKLAGRRTVVVGAGTVGERKVQELLAAHATVTVIAPEATPALQRLASDGSIVWHARAYAGASDLDGAWLVVSATGAPDVQRAIHGAADALHAFVIAVDDPANGSAETPAIIRRDPYVIAISSRGETPALTRLLREILEQALPEASWVRAARALRLRWRATGTPMASRFPELLRLFRSPAGPLGVPCAPPGPSPVASGSTPASQGDTVNAPLADIRALPLFAGIPAEHLEALFKELSSTILPEGHALFRAGDVPTELVVLVRGEVTLEDDGHPKFRVRPVAPIGELGALTGLPHNATAIAATEIEVQRVPVETLLAFFARRPEIAFPFYKNLLLLVSAKVRRDEHRLEEMRANLIRTQKTMKGVREVVLASPETAISKPVCDALDDLIEHNRRSHYRVTPAAGFAAAVRLDDSAIVRVVDLSDGYLKLDAKSDRLTKDRSHWAGVLVLPLGEILVSGSIERDGPDGSLVKLDPMIDSYKRQLEDYVTRLQLLNYVV